VSCLGVHFALSKEDLDALLAFESDDERLEFLQEEIEERYFQDEDGGWKAESDKSWDAMHRLLADGSLDPNGGTYPLNHAVLGGRSLYGDDDFIVSLKTPEQVRDIAAALAALTIEQARERFDAIDPDDFGMDLGDDGFDYTWDWFEGVRALYARAATAGPAVVFTADQ